MVRVRPMTRADVPFADRLRALAQWNQTIADWERLLELGAGGCFVAEWNETAVGTATTIVYGPDLAWIGMVLVDPEYRRRGLGRALLEYCLAYLQRRAVRCIKLDATPSGKQVYDQLGFREEWTITRWSGAGLARPRLVIGQQTRDWREEDVDRIQGVDLAAFGVSRRALVQALVRQRRAACVVEEDSRQIAAYGLMRLGATACYLGPVVGQAPTAGLSVIETLAAQVPGEPLLWDLPDANRAAVEWAQAAGFVPQRPLIRMYLGDNLAPGHPQRQFGLAGPEVG